MNLGCVTAYNNNIIYRDFNSGNFIQQLDGYLLMKRIFELKDITIKGRPGYRTVVLFRIALTVEYVETQYGTKYVNAIWNAAPLLKDSCINSGPWLMIASMPPTTNETLSAAETTSLENTLASVFPSIFSISKHLFQAAKRDQSTTKTHYS